VQSIDFLSTITGFVFQFFDKQMIAYDFVPVGGPGSAKMSGLRPGSLFRRANTAFPCLVGAGSASEVRWLEGGPCLERTALSACRGERFQIAAGFLLPDKICR